MKHVVGVKPVSKGKKAIRLPRERSLTEKVQGKFWQKVREMSFTDWERKDRKKTNKQESSLCCIIRRERRFEG